MNTDSSDGHNPMKMAVNTRSLFDCFVVPVVTLQSITAVPILHVLYGLTKNGKNREILKCITFWNILKQMPILIFGHVKGITAIETSIMLRQQLELEL